MSSSNLVTTAYSVFHYQLSAPDWMDHTRFDITAKVPPGTTREQLQAMQRNLLAERFQLSLHHESKEMQMYELTVGRNGAKLKESDPARKGDEPALPSPAGTIPKFSLGSDGFPVLPANANMMVMESGRARRQHIGESMPEFARFLSGQLALPVADSTGLMGRYDTVLSWAAGTRMEASPEGGSVAPPDADSLPTLVQAVQGLGLRLEQKKGPVDILVIDHMEKTPVGN